MRPAKEFGLDKAAYSVAGVSEMTSLRRTTIYEFVKTGRLKATKCGRRTLFLATDIAEFLSALQAGSR
jgi:excisionase family DNA binding protein